MRPLLQALGICRRFGEKTVLDGISLSVSPGEIFGLLGPSGAGKTTLIRILTGQLRQNSGTALLLGTDTRQLTDAQRRDIGAMMDSFGLYERLPVRDNLQLFASLFHLPKDAWKSALQEVGLADAAGVPAGRLSKGMKSRVSLARALLSHPKILFLDEPTSGLDPRTSREIHALLRRRQSEGTAIFLTTHNMQEAQSLCTTVSLLDQGRIIESGPPEEICRRYNHLKSIRVLCRNGKTLVLPAGRESAGTLYRLLEADRIETIHSSEPNLEDVFLQLTGKGLQDDEPCVDHF